MDDLQFRELLNRFNLSWKGYRRVRKGVKKRIARHMNYLGCRNLNEYLEVLDKNHEHSRQFECLITVSISKFFRDRALWETLEADILPRLIQTKVNVNVWSAGCACGEEVYSFNILWERLKTRFNIMPNLNILATDINSLYLNRAKNAVYSRSSLKELPEQWKPLYFNSLDEGRLYEVRPFLKKNIIFRKHNLLIPLKETSFDIILLRNNLLTYYDGEICYPALRRVIDRLAFDGFLAVGANEKIPEGIDLIIYGGIKYLFNMKKRINDL